MLLFLMVLSSLLLLLGATLLNLAVTEGVIASNQEKGMQAIYLAEAGADMAAGILLESDPQYRGVLEGELEAGRIVTEVEGYFDAEGGSWIEIICTGMAGNITRSSILRFNTVPGTPPDAVSGSAIGWFSEESGEITPSIADSITGAVKFASAAPGGEVWLEKESTASLAAEGMYFEGEQALEVHGELTLAAEVVVLRGEVLLQGEDASLTFKPVEEIPIRVYFQEDVHGTGFSLPTGHSVYLFKQAFTIHAGTLPEGLESHAVLPLVPDSKKWSFK